MHLYRQTTSNSFLSSLKERVEASFLASQVGQGTVEYAIVFVAFIFIIIAFVVISDFLRSGSLIEHVLMSASHHLSGSSSGALKDIFIY